LKKLKVFSNLSDKSFEGSLKTLQDSYPETLAFFKVKTTGLAGSKNFIFLPPPKRCDKAFY
jgi:uncharacterized protein YprB with RNaseH-like and TPR domain